MSTRSVSKTLAVEFQLPTAVTRGFRVLVSRPVQPSSHAKHTEGPARNIAEGRL